MYTVRRQYSKLSCLNFCACRQWTLSSDSCATAAGTYWKQSYSLTYCGGLCINFPVSTQHYSRIYCIVTKWFTSENGMP